MFCLLGAREKGIRVVVVVVGFFSGAGSACEKKSLSKVTIRWLRDALCVFQEAASRRTEKRGKVINKTNLQRIQGEDV